MLPEGSISRASCIHQEDSRECRLSRDIPRSSIQQGSRAIPAKHIRDNSIRLRSRAIPARHIRDNSIRLHSRAIRGSSILPVSRLFQDSSIPSGSRAIPGSGIRRVSRASPGSSILWDSSRAIPGSSILWDSSRDTQASRIRSRGRECIRAVSMAETDTLRPDISSRRETRREAISLRLPIIRTRMETRADTVMLQEDRHRADTRTVRHLRSSR